MEKDILRRRRAVHDDQKEVRRQAILDMAWHMFQTEPYETLTMAAVANALGLAKGTLFLYFKTKEALFLIIVQQQLTDWFRAVDAHLTALGAHCASSQVVDVICTALEQRPGLTRLLAILHTALEQNIDREMAVAFKHFLLDHFTRTGLLLEQCLPFLSPGQGSHLLLQSQALVIGFWHLADPAPVVRLALQQPELQVFEVHFAAEFSSSLQQLLYGLEHEAQSMQSAQSEI